MGGKLRGVMRQSKWGPWHGRQGKGGIRQSKGTMTWEAGRGRGERRDEGHGMGFHWERVWHWRTVKGDGGGWLGHFFE
jgi:hypothetical protein